MHPSRKTSWNFRLWIALPAALGLLVSLLVGLPANPRLALALQLSGPPDGQGNYGVCNLDWGPLFQDQNTNWHRVERFTCNTGPDYHHGLRIKGRFDSGNVQNWDSWGTWNAPWTDPNCQGMTSQDTYVELLRNVTGLKCWMVGNGQQGLLSGNFVQASPPNAWICQHRDRLCASSHQIDYVQQQLPALA